MDAFMGPAQTPRHETVQDTLNLDCSWSRSLSVIRLAQNQKACVAPPIVT